MRNKPIRVLVVDDSPLIRELICDLLAQEQGIEVVGTASDGKRALELIAELHPDLVTLDLQMPKMDGLTTLDHILASDPLPVIVVSSLTQPAADITMQALERGALDYVPKPVNAQEVRRALGQELPAKIRGLTGADVRRILHARQSRALRQERNGEHFEPGLYGRMVAGCVAIGVSTGGPPALSKLFASLVPPLPPIVVVQHMPRMFTGPFASRLNSLSAITVKEAATGDILRPGFAYIAPGGAHLALVRRGDDVQVSILDGEPVSGHKPSVDVMMFGAAEAFAEKCMGVIMTGMGRDGTDGCAAIQAHGGYVLGQDETTSDVYGMNKAAFLEGHVNQQVALDDLAETITHEARFRCASQCVPQFV